MGWAKMLSNHLPGVKYVRSVQEGTEVQKERAEQLQKETAPIVANLKALYVQNHFKDLVNGAFFSLGRGT